MAKDSNFCMWIQYKIDDIFSLDSDCGKRYFSDHDLLKNLTKKCPYCNKERKGIMAEEEITLANLNDKEKEKLSKIKEEMKKTKLH